VTGEFIASTGNDATFFLHLLHACNSRGGLFLAPLRLTVTGYRCRKRAGLHGYRKQSTKIGALGGAWSNYRGSPIVAKHRDVRERPYLPPLRASLPAWPGPASRPVPGLTFSLPLAMYVLPWTARRSCASLRPRRTCLPAGKKKRGPKAPFSVPIDTADQNLCFRPRVQRSVFVPDETSSSSMLT